MRISGKSIRSRNPYPLIVHLININAVFLGGWLFPFCGTSALVAIAVFLVVVNSSVFLGLRSFFERASMSVFKVPLAKEVALSISAIIVFFGATEYLARLATNCGLIGYHSPVKTMLAKGIANEEWRLVHITADAYRETDPLLFWRPIKAPPL